MNVFKRIGNISPFFIVCCLMFSFQGSFNPLLFAEEATGPTFRIFRYPNTSWRYDEQMGQSYRPIWEQGSIVNGAFNSFGSVALLNKYGNYGEAIGSYLDADVKVAMFGSSFTSTKCSNMLQQKLEKALGKSVHVLNFSVGSNGFLSMFDIARVKIPEFRPDILLFPNNASAYLYSRIWRFDAPAGDHFWHFVQSFEPKQVFDPNVAHIHPATIITDLITDDWLDRMRKAKKEGDEKTLREDSLVKQMIGKYEELLEYTKLLDEVYGPAVIALPKDYSYLEDQRFMDAVEYVKGTGIPYYIVHVPQHSEVKSENPSDFAFGSAGVPEEQGRRYAAELDQIMGKETIHLVDFYDPEDMENPSLMFGAPVGGHPSERGNEVMAGAFVKMLMEKVYGDR
jgi:hypothetical protein